MGNTRFYPVSEEVRTGEWKLDARCQNIAGDWIGMPEGYNRKTYRSHKSLELAVCEICPVRKFCLEHAIVFGEELGIWGGTLPHERTQKRPTRYG